MKRLHLFLLLTALTACGPSPQSSLRGTVRLGQNDSCQIFITGVDFREEVKPDSAGAFTFMPPDGHSTIVMLAGVVFSGTDRWQFSAPLYIAHGKKTSFGIDLTHGRADFSFDPRDADNRALADYNEFTLTKDRSIWEDVPAVEDAAASLGEFLDQARRRESEYDISPDVSDFLRVWAAENYLGGLSALDYSYARSPRRSELPPPSSLPGYPRVLDNPRAMLFYSAPGHVYSYLKSAGPEPEDRLERLAEEFRTPELVDAVRQIILTDFIARYDYSDYENGLERLRLMTAGEEDADKYLDDFKSKRYSVVGAPVPDAPLIDRDGNPVKLSDFAGKYLYIDVWASWCVPCRAEVPHLKKLEHESRNDRVAFVSISIDEDRGQWLAALDQLSLSGNQLLASDGTFARMLNISSIPQFIIYGKDGRMKVYNAPRPSSGEELKSLLEKLE